MRAQGLPYGMLVSQVACLPLGRMLPLFNCFPALCVPHPTSIPLSVPSSVVLLATELSLSLINHHTCDLPALFLQPVLYLAGAQWPPLEEDFKLCVAVTSASLLVCGEQTAAVSCVWERTLHWEEGEVGPGLRCVFV